MKVGKGINKMSLVPGFFSGDFNNSTHSSPKYRMAFVKDNLGIRSARLLRAADDKYANFQRVE